MPENSDILNLDQACEYLNISIKTFQKLLREENIPARKVDREWRFSKKALQEWVGEGKSANFKAENE